MSILRSQLQLRQARQVRLIGREPGQARMGSMLVVPGQVVGDVSTRGADAVVGLQVHPLVLDAAPQALHEHVVSPGTAAVHGQPAAAAQNDLGEFDRGELAALVSETASPLGEPGWIYEVKYDGWRLMAGAAVGKVHIRTRGGANYTRVFPEIVEAVSALQGGPHILDGEGVVVDERGRSSFDRFQDRALPRRPPPPGADRVLFMVFDILMLDGQALIDEPVERRKDLLQQLLGSSAAALRYVEHAPWDQGRSMFQQAKKLGLEGLVAKRLGSVYRPGERTSYWQKVKVPGAVPAERFKRS
jgi:bifunctional non-homologous end joining protein LigD